MCPNSPPVGEIAQSGLIGLLVACTVMNVAASVALARASLPARLRKWRERADTRIEELAAVVDDVNKRAKLWDSTISGLIEENTNAFDRAERKRASVSSAASRAQATTPDVESMPRAERLAYKRAQMARS